MASSKKPGEMVMNGGNTTREYKYTQEISQMVSHALFSTVPEPHSIDEPDVRLRRSPRTQY
jgi:hypothetical protein